MSTDQAEPVYNTWCLEWDGLTIEVRLCRNWLNGSYDHLELKCAEPLPVTSTGYRSRFIPSADAPGDEDVLSFVVSWLDHAAENPHWQKYIQASRQGSLF